MGRRGADDEEWQECKRKVQELDKGVCLLCSAMTVAESIVFNNSKPYNTVKMDPAHHIAVSQRTDIMYDPNNVFTLCREHHNRLDQGRNPITGDFCKKEETEKYWQRIIAKRNENVNGTPEVQLPEFFEDFD